RVRELSQPIGLASAFAVFAAGAYGVFILAAFALPEARGKVVHADG
ncbi:MFS transporter, partial [Methylobacterium sp. E-025]|nr:MFS transporter [Methylobacterium sp. E-025]